IFAAAGLYEEQVIINKSLSIIGAPGAAVRAPAAASKRAVRFAESTKAGGTPYTWNPIVLAYGGSMDDEGNISGSGTIDVYIEGLTIDGRDLEPAAQRAAGILFRIAGRAAAPARIAGSDVTMKAGSKESMGIVILGDSH